MRCGSHGADCKGRRTSAAAPDKKWSAISQELKAALLSH
eukprot:CAMPEP_0177309308 /NCGR_PEP_ID=MMETSP0368-20130122/9215_1 /TAXON_ID=447022 ORGANISM="Scrippsiella hangoei-like, Strain SHHI-4" /NCGR_SAMPLE_ID=MMETSP0368 /ASSEMBLY_ACC=CAM_ASM_000363 /LENGTH=38 /DNA_ID= /DNA_START= /DNA_END= /DNA_ORIENTATION=